MPAIYAQCCLCDWVQERPLPLNFQSITLCAVIGYAYSQPSDVVGEASPASPIEDHTRPTLTIRSLIFTRLHRA